MQYAYAYQLNGTQAGGLDPDAKAYINAVVAAGATVTSTKRTAINNFVKGEKAGSRWTLLKRLYLPIWGVAAPNAICMTSLTSGTFNGGITHASGYVSTNGTTGYFLLDQAPASLGLTTSSGSVYALVTANSAFNASTVLGRTQDANNTRTGFFGAGGTSRSVSISSSAALTYSDADSRGVVISSRTSTTTTSAYTRKSTGFATVINEGASLVGAVGTVQPMTYMAWNNNGAISTFSPSTVRFGSYGMGLGMTSTQAENFSAGLKTLWETCTGLALP
jgi:hypothetical protein